MNNAIRSNRNNQLHYQSDDDDDDEEEDDDSDGAGWCVSSHGRESLKGVKLREGTAPLPVLRGTVKVRECLKCVNESRTVRGDQEKRSECRKKKREVMHCGREE